MSLETLPASAKKATQYFIDNSKLRKGKRRDALIDQIAQAKRPMVHAKKLLDTFGKPKPASLTTKEFEHLFLEHVAKSGLPDPTVLPMIKKAKLRAYRQDLSLEQAKHVIKIAGRAFNGRCQDEIDQSRDAARLALGLDPYVKPEITAKKPEVSPSMAENKVADAIGYVETTASDTARRFYAKAIAENARGELTTHRAEQIARLISVR
ncbi:hypothetical protein [Ruegeria sp. THAF33]|uniref:hypothetical protein n=1 Tax=Ruegeria sp. THAF33 TaxID=2587853 RepID=UPI001267A5A4|nr:hypothetical protein [Ruegeria sp. THAF33]QFT72177.1 hypothetical protein FIU92_03990 [Ruegeria sp. THAF33]